MFGPFGLSGGRLIPAHAGKTTSTYRAPSAPGAHPRSRGENARSSFALSRRAGSSPLTRGKLSNLQTAGTSQGLIPAHAGKTHARSFQFTLDWAHPRSRGENSLPAQGMTLEFGSSPLTRGKPRDLVTARIGSRLIPAHAGKTIYPDPSRSALEAHPRSRGENCATTSDAVMMVGSSPLTRGKPIFAPGLPIRIRLIPAHAGKT